MEESILGNYKICNRIQIESQRFQLLAKVTTLIITDSISQPIKQNTKSLTTIHHCLIFPYVFYKGPVSGWFQMYPYN